MLSILFCIFSILFLTSSCSLFALLLIVSLFSVWIPLILFSRFSWSFLSFPSVSFLELSKTSSSFAWTASILSLCLVSILSIMLCISTCNLFIFFICKSWLLYFLFNCTISFCFCLSLFSICSIFVTSSSCLEPIVSNSALISSIPLWLFSIPFNCSCWLYCIFSITFIFSSKLFNWPSQFSFKFTIKSSCFRLETLFFSSWEFCYFSITFILSSKIFNCFPKSDFIFLTSFW